MFGIVAPIVMGLLRAVFGIIPGSSSGSSILTVVGGTASAVAVRFNALTAGIYENSNNFYWALGGNTVLKLGAATQGTKMASGGFYTWASGDPSGTSADVGFGRVAAGVAKVTAGEAGDGWLQVTSGRSVGTAGATNVTITPATTGCSVTLIAGRKYAFKLVLWTTNVTAADGLRVDFDGGTATMTSFMQNGFVTDTASVRSLPQTTALATDVTDTTTTGAAMSVFEGYMVVNGAGTFIPRFAKEADAAGATITLNNAVLLVEDMP